jgi:hypothetical protein
LILVRGKQRPFSFVLVSLLSIFSYISQLLQFTAHQIMAATSSPTPILFSVLTASHDHSDDFVNQLRNHLTQIETNVQQTLNKIQQRKPYTSISTNTNKLNPQIRNHFFDV